MLMRDVEAVPATPPRSFSPMRAQPLVPWTPARFLVAAWGWLMAEDRPQLERRAEIIAVAENRLKP